jgi:hypothetical protein
MKIKSLVITTAPIWFDIPDAKLEHFTISADVRFWPENAGAAMFSVELPVAADAEELSRCGLTMASFGPYVYLAVDATRRRLQQTVHFPQGLVNRVGLRLWNCRTPIVLENVSITAIGGSLHSEHAFTERLAGLELPHLSHLTAGCGAMALNIAADTPECTPECHAISQQWSRTMDDVQRRYPKEDVGRTNCLLDTGDQIQVPVSVLHAQPAMLRIPATLDEYHAKIGDKSRNMIRKAQRLGYTYQEVDPDQYLDDVLAIRLSDPIRQGKPIPEYFKVRPTTIYDRNFLGGCDRHGERFYGIFLKGRLVAYSTLYCYGELAQINHLLGHKEHLPEGVMNLLFSEMVGSIISKQPWIKAINYLYMGAVHADKGLGMFKRSMGFAPETVLTTHSRHDIASHFAPPPAQAAAPVPARTSAKADASKSLKKADAEALILAEPLRDRASALAFGLEALRERSPSLQTIRLNAGTADAIDAAPDSDHAVLVEDLTFANYLDFISTGLKQCRNVVRKNAYLVLDFKCRPALSHVPGKPTLLQRWFPSRFSNNHAQLNADLIAYLAKRFKSAELTLEHIRNGFKGSDYVVAGFLEHGESHAYDQFDSVLILKKIR